MSKTVKTKSGRVIIMPAQEEDKAINAGIMADADNPEISEKAFKSAKPASVFFSPEQLAGLNAKRSRGRPHADQPKVSTSIRLDADLLDALRATGRGWQSRVNSILRDKIMRDQ